MKAKETNLLYARSSSTLGGTTLEKLLKEYVSDKFDKAVIEDKLIGEVLADIQQKARTLHALNPRCRGIEVTLEDDAHGIKYYTSHLYWINANGELLLTIEKAKCSYLSEKGGAE